MILIVSKDRYFSAAIAEQVARELKLPCREAETADRALLAAAHAVVADVGLDAPVPVVALDGEKPVRMREVLARIEAVLASQAAPDMTLGKAAVFSPLRKQLVHRHSGKAVDLTDKEAGLLQCLARAGKKGLGREALMKEVWGAHTALNTHTLETHIYRLRGKLRELSGDEAIEAMEGGYKLQKV